MSEPSAVLRPTPEQPNKALSRSSLCVTTASFEHYVNQTKTIRVASAAVLHERTALDRAGSRKRERSCR